MLPSFWYSNATIRPTFFHLERFLYYDFRRALELDEALCHAAADMGFETPTSIQELVIPHALDGREHLKPCQSLLQVLVKQPLSYCLDVVTAHASFYLIIRADSLVLHVF